MNNFLISYIVTTFYCFLLSLNTQHNATLIRRNNSRLEEEQFDEIVTKVNPEELQTSPDIRLQKFVRLESGDSGVPPSPDSDSPDFDAIRDKPGVRILGDGEDSVFFDDKDAAMLPTFTPEKLTVRIGRVEGDGMCHVQWSPKGATSPSSPIESVGSYTQVGELPFSKKPSLPLALLGGTVKSISRKVSFDVSDKPTSVEENAQEERQGKPSHINAGRSPSSISFIDVLPFDLTEMSPNGSLHLRRQGSTPTRQCPSMGAVKSQEDTSSPLPSSLPMAVSPYMSTLESQMFLYPYKHEYNISDGQLACVGDSKRQILSPSSPSSPTAIDYPCTHMSPVKHARLQIRVGSSDCSDIQAHQPIPNSSYTQMSPIVIGPRHKVTEQLQTGTSDHEGLINQVSYPSSSISAEMEASQARLHNTDPTKQLIPSNDVAVNPSHSPLSILTPTVTTSAQRIPEIGHLQLQSDKLSHPLFLDTAHNLRSQSSPRSYLSSAGSSYMQMEYLQLRQQKTLHTTLQPSVFSAQSPVSSLSHVSAADAPGTRKRGERQLRKGPSSNDNERLEETDLPLLKMPPPGKRDASLIPANTLMASAAAIVETPFDYVQASSTRSDVQSTSDRRPRVDLSTFQDTTPPLDLPRASNSCSDLEDEIPSYSQISTDGSSLDTGIADYTQTARDESRPNPAQLALGYVSST